MRRLDPETWRRLAPLLDEALERPEDDRTAFVERALTDEPELREILLELVDAEHRAGGLLETSAAGLADSLSREPAAPGPPPRVEGYSGLEEIGRGGMGLVYRATRQGDGYEQEVALKVVRPGMDDAAMLQRFERERSILAGLEHPNIARLVDGGTTADGRSFFAMEYVDGTPITRHADERRLTLDQRLALFAEVCAAVSFAQQHLVVHRDLKPSNILVDAEGRVRLLDFGIARLVDPDAPGPHAELTREGSRLLTPEYAAPEQLRGEPPSTATDVFALGVILFELLSGRHPHGDTRAGALEVAMGMRESRWLPRAVGEDHRVLRPDGTIEVVTAREVAEARRLSPRALRRALGGDLALLCATALQAEPAARYPSAEALLADLNRFRRGHPLEARPPSWRYRARKYLQRHRTPAIAALLVVLALGGGLAVSVWQARLAEREAERAQRAYDFLARLFEDAHPDAARGTDWTAAELLERGAERLATAWPDDPHARQRLQQNIATILTERGDYELAARMLREAIERDDTVERDQLRLALARVELYRGRSATADSLLAVVDRGGHRLRFDERRRYLESAASIRYGQGAYAEAESLTRVVMELTLDDHDSTSTEYAEDLNNLATYQAARARYDEAERNYRRALEIFDQARPRPLSDIALAHHNLGDLYRTAERNEEALEEFRRAVALRRRLYPDGHDRLAESLRGLAVSHRRLEQLDVADSLLAEAATMVEASLGTDSEVYARALNELAILAYRRDDLDTARELFSRANAIFESTLGPTHPITLTVTNNLATVQSMTGRAAEAETTFRKVLERRREVLGDDHPDVAFSYNSIGSVLRKLDRPQDAVGAHREALLRYRRIHGDEHSTVASTRTQLGSALRESGELEEALDHLRAALAWREQHLPAAHRDIADTRISLGFTLTRAGRWAEAHEELLEAEGEVERTLGPDSTWLAGARAARGLCLARLGQRDEGRRLADDACATLVEAYGSEDPRARRALSFRDGIDRP